jgi:hypothetical protein
MSVGEGIMVGAVDWAGIARASLSTAACSGAVTAEEDGKGEEVDEDGGGIGGIGAVVGLLTAAAPHVHFSRRIVNKIHVSLDTCTVSSHIPATIYPQVFVPTVGVLSVQSAWQYNLRMKKLKSGTCKRKTECIQSLSRAFES